MTLSNFFNFEQVETENGPVVRVPRGMVLENYVLQFCTEWDEGGPVMDIPLTSWNEHDEVIGVWAPELQHEGGVRGLRMDPPQESGGPPPWHLPLAPNRPDTDPYKPVSEMEVDVRRRTSWGFTPLKGIGGLSRFKRRSQERMVD